MPFSVTGIILRTEALNPTTGNEDNLQLYACSIAVLIECRFIERERFLPPLVLGEWDYQQSLRKLVKKSLTQSGKMIKSCMKFQDILPDRRQFYLTRLDMFRED